MLADAGTIPPCGPGERVNGLEDFSAIHLRQLDRIVRRVPTRRAASAHLPRLRAVRRGRTYWIGRQPSEDAYADLCLLLVESVLT